MSLKNVSGFEFDDLVANNKDDLICLSHLRWNFVYQRPQHLMSRFARERRVFFFEEPVIDEGPPRLVLNAHSMISGEAVQLWVVVPHIPGKLSDEERVKMLSTLIDQLIKEYDIHAYVLWYYTAEAMQFTHHLKPKVTVYDCMDELSLFKNANPKLHDLEIELFSRADLVFTGGRSLYEAKRSLHEQVHCFQSSIDAKHFGQARERLQEPPDQETIPHPRLGFFGVLDERLDIQLLAGVASARPDWQIVLVGPVVKIDAEHLPKNVNIHYMGMKDYQDLPGYLAGWDVALLPFAINESTRYISPTKTPEYLAGGKPVVSTPIRDVVQSYGEKQLVRIAATVDEFVRAVEEALHEKATNAWLTKRDAFLADMSWDNTWQNMDFLIEGRAQKPTEEFVKVAQDK
jgi:UDP-galactopyranose mutase